MASGRCRALQVQAQKQSKVKGHEASVVQDDLQHETGDRSCLKLAAVVQRSGAGATCNGYDVWVGSRQA